MSYKIWAASAHLTFGIIHLWDLPLCSLRSLWLNHTNTTDNDMNALTVVVVAIHKP